MEHWVKVIRVLGTKGEKREKPYLLSLCVLNELFPGLNELFSLQELSVVATLMGLVDRACLLGQGLVLHVHLLNSDDPHSLLKCLGHQCQLVAQNFRWHRL